MTEMIQLDSQATAAGLPFDTLIAALETGFARGCQAPIRHHHTLHRETEPDATLLLMPAWSNPEDATQLLGVKLVTVVPGNAARGLPGLVSTYLLYDAVTGRQLAMMDGNTITGRRTVATSALAARYLSRHDSMRLLVVGAGRVASLIPEAYLAVRPIEEIEVWDVNPESAARLVAGLTASGFRAQVADNLEVAVRRADIISAATLATEPLILGNWLQPGTHLDLIGSFRPNMREADTDAIKGSALFVDTDEALVEAGDIVQPIRAGAITKAHVRGTLAQLACADVEGRTTAKQITCFKAVGSALADLTAASLVHAARSPTTGTAAASSKSLRPNSTFRDRHVQ